jgi:hypothetical protein
MFYRPVVTDLLRDAERLRSWHAGMIETRQGELCQIVWRGWGRRLSWLESRTVGRLWHRCWRGDVCRLYFRHPRRHPDFLTLDYVESNAGTRLVTFRRALTTLDEIARLKNCWAVVCDASNERISDRLLARWGWEPHAPMPWRRNFIKRLAGADHRWHATLAEPATLAATAE